MAAQKIGEGIARRQWTLVWGGGANGLMGAVSRGAKENGGRVVGIQPHFIGQIEPPYDRADEMIVTTTMQERKTILMLRADSFLVLPGGIGTLDELAEVFDLGRLKQHAKPIILYNQDGYYDHLLAFLEHSIAAKFSKESVKEHLLVARTIDEIFELLESSLLQVEKTPADTPR